MLIVHDRGIGRGIFDRGATDRYIYEKNLKDSGWPLDKEISGALRDWRDNVLAEDAREQERLEKLEDQAREQNRAKLTARLERDSTWAGKNTKHRVVIENQGPADAENIDVTFPEGDDPVPTNERRRKLPLDSLPAGTDYKLVATISHDNGPPFDALVSWTDGNGDQEKKFPLS